MYEDLDWYSRFSLQKEIYNTVYDLYYKNEQIDSVVLYIPSMNKAISELRCQIGVTEWMQEMAQGQDGTCMLDDGRAATSIHWDSDGESAVLVLIWKDSGIMKQAKTLFLSGGDSIDCIWEPEELNEQDIIYADSQFYPFRMIYKESKDHGVEQFIALIGLCSIGFMLLCLVIAAVSIRNWYREIYRPLYRLLIEAFDHMENNDFGYRIEPEKENIFFHSVYDKYNHMAQTMQQYIETNLQQQILVSQSDLKQLQSQISPHFMYNSYYVLYRMIRKGDYENSLHMAEYLGSFYHYITRNSDDEKRLSQELDHARNYAQIQKYRFRENLDIKIPDPDEQIADVYVPRLILQPILENAFKYAYESGNGDPMKLEISYKVCSERDFCIIIENSGEISDDTLKMIDEKLCSTDMQIETTAIININRRLKLYFGEKSGLSVERSELGGLKVTMHIFRGEEM